MEVVGRLRPRARAGGLAEAIARMADLRSAPSRLLVAAAPAPEVEPEALEALAAGGSLGPGVVWSAPGEAPSVGFGEAARLEVAGSDLAPLAEAARLLAGGAQELGPAAPPSLRFLGGVAFRPSGGPRTGAWSGFADASFVLPRWLYGRGPGGEPTLRLVCRAEEADPAVLLGELDRIERALAGAEAPAPERAPAASSVPPEAPAWTALVERALAGIEAGAFEKVVTASAEQALAARPFDLGAALGRLASAYPECARFLLVRGGKSFVGATPERLVSLSAGAFEVDALAGTRRASDAGAAEALLSDDKERREHAFVVRGVESALAPLAERLEIPGEPGLKRLRNVLHLWTPLRGRLARPAHVLDLVSALHPTPAVSGHPRAPALAFLEAEEGFDRGWYAGPVGWFDAAGDGSFWVGLRCALVAGAEAWLFAGAGIVRGSRPERELSETASKRAALRAALGLA